MLHTNCSKRHICFPKWSFLNVESVLRLVCCIPESGFIFIKRTKTCVVVIPVHYIFVVVPLRRLADGTTCIVIGADFRFEVPGQSSVGLIGGWRGQWLGGTMASAEHEPIMGVWGQSSQRGPGAEPLVRGTKPPEAESILVIGCPTEPANLAPLVKFSK